MKLKILWPGKTQNPDLRNLQQAYLTKIQRLETCELFETREAKGIPEKNLDKIQNIEASGLEKFIKDDYIICLDEKGTIMDSKKFARHMEHLSLNYPHEITFIVGGFLGISERLLKRSDLLLSLSKMTFSHELTRVVLLEQIYRSLSMIKGRKYAK